MQIEKIEEPVGVLAVFSAGDVSPVRFRWHSQEYDIFSINGRWTDRQNDGYARHYSVQVGDETYYLHFGSHDMQWWLDQVVLNG